jgi:hypothetical protein
MRIRFARLAQLAQTLSLGVVLAGVSLSVARADDPAEPARVRQASVAPAATAPLVSPGEATPEMWFYEQALHQYNDPKYAVRANAEFKANQRRQRLAAMQWYGYSNSRPEMGLDTQHGIPQAQWVGNGASPNWWVAPAARPLVIVNAPFASHY